MDQQVSVSPYPHLDPGLRDKIEHISALRGPSARLIRERLYHAVALMEAPKQRDAIRFLVRDCYDLYFWFTYVLRRTDGRTQTTIETKSLGKAAEQLIVPTADWVFARCNQVADSPNGHLDLWAREHYKSSIITFALSLMEVAIDPELTVGVFSFRGAAAADFVTQWKIEMETNPLLPWAFDDVFWQNPKRQAPAWSTQSGLIVKRRGNPREATFEGNGLEYGAPVGKHYKLRVYDDVVTEDSVIGDAPRRIIKAWELSLNLGTVDGQERYAGTRYAFTDAYGEMMKRRAVTPRIFEAEITVEWCECEFAKDGSVIRGELRHERQSAGFMPLPLLDKKRQSMGSFTYAAQMKLDPRGDSLTGFNIQDLRSYGHIIDRSTVNVYLIVDPAKGKTKRPTRSDYAAFEVWGVGADRNYYLLDMVHDRLTLSQRTDTLIELYRHWKPNVVGYEQVGMQSDIEHIEGVCRKLTYNIPIKELTPSIPKDIRIEKLIPIVEERRIWLPETLMRKRVNEAETVDLASYFVHTEFANYPAITYDDLLDCAAWIVDPQMSVVFPELAYGVEPDGYRQDPFDDGDWMGG